MFYFIKPWWVENLLNNLNWDILGWQIYVGDAIESAIDWVLNLFNTVIMWVENLQDWFEDFRQEVLDGFNTFVDWLEDLYQRTLGLIDGIYESISAWWSDRVDDILDIVYTVRDGILDFVGDVIDTVEAIAIWWENFRYDILPELLTFSFLTDWWRGVSRDIIDAINQNTEWLDMIRDFIDDPAQFVYNKLDEFFERFW
jgi:hypothetical protein